MQEVIELSIEELAVNESLSESNRSLGSQRSAGARGLAAAFWCRGLRLKLTRTAPVLRVCDGRFALFPLLFELAHIPLLLGRVAQCRCSLDRGRHGHFLLCRRLRAPSADRDTLVARLWLSGNCMDCNGCRHTLAQGGTAEDLPRDEALGLNVDADSLSAASERLMRELLSRVAWVDNGAMRQWLGLVAAARTAPSAVIQCERSGKQGPWSMRCAGEGPLGERPAHRDAYTPGPGQATRLAAALRSVLVGPLCEIAYSLPIGIALLWREENLVQCLALRRVAWLRIELAKDEPWREPRHEVLLIEEIQHRLWRVTHWQESGLHLMAYARRLELILGEPSTVASKRQPDENP